MSDDATRAGKRGARAPEPIRKVGRFVVDGVLGEGGMGVVLAAHDPDLDRKVAIKLLHADDGEGSSGRGRLLREAQAMARLRHPNVVTVHEVGRHDGDVYVAMEYVPGGTLRRWLSDHPHASCAEVLARFVPAGRGLAAAHAAGLVHRDFKPDNVMVDDDGRVLVTDFGIAGLGDAPPEPTTPASPDDAPSANESTMVTGAEPAPRREVLPDGISPRTPLAQTLTRTGDVMGTPRYMSPEQHLAAPTDARSDQFAFCAALYEAVFGVKAFAGEIYEAIRQHALDGVLTPPPADREVPPRVRDAIVRGLKPSPDDRWPTMEALLAELEPPEAAPVRASTGWWIAGAVAGLAGVAGVAVVLWPRAPDPGAKAKAAERAAKACDCELVTIALPLGAKLDGARLGTGQLAVPPGDQRIAYTVGGARYEYALRGGGFGASRTIALPMPETRDGFVFVPGGDVPIGDLDGDGEPDEQPAGVVHLAPYLIAIHETGAELAFADARVAARQAHARLPTAAEWEWAARLGVIDDALGARWEWTATRHAAYPYADDGRDDAYADGETIEVRGGQLADGAGRDAPRPSRRLDARRTGQAELRLARTPASVRAPREITVRAQPYTTRPEPHREHTEAVVHPVDLVALHQFVEAWGAQDDPPALQLVKGKDWCPALHALLATGVPDDHVEVIDGPGGDTVIVRWNPTPGYRGESPRCVTTSSDMEILDRICFDGDALRASSAQMIQLIANQVRDTAELGIEIHTHVAPGTPDAQALTQRRGERVRDRLVDAGIAASRLRVIAHGDTEPLVDLGGIDGGVSAAAGLTGGATGEPCEPGPDGRRDRVDLQVFVP